VAPAGHARARRLAAAAAFAVCLGLLGAYALTLGSGVISPRQSDFITYFSAGKLVLAGKGRLMYDFSALARLERGVVHPYTLRYGVLPYVYPPYFALAIAPLSRLPLDQAYAAWLAISAAILSCFLWATSRYAGLTRAQTWLYAAATASFVPTFMCLVHGQTSIALLGLLTLALFSLRRDRQVPAGVALGLALVKPPLVLPLVLFLVVSGRRRALGAFFGTAAMLTLLPLPAFGWSVNAGYLHVLRLAAGWTTQFGYSPELSISLSGLTGALLPRSAATVSTLALDIACLALVMVAARRGGPIELSFALAVLCGLLISPHVLVHDVVIAYLPVAAALANRRRAAVPLSGALAACYVVMLLGFATVSHLHLQLAALGIVILFWWLADAAGIHIPTSLITTRRKAAYGS
jgi:hypothetical protein